MSGRVMQLELGLDVPSPGVTGSLRRISLAGGPLWYDLVRARRRTISIVVDRGTVQVRAPRWTAIAEIETFMAEKEAWIRRRIEDSRRVPAPFSWHVGDRLPVLGEPLALALSASHDTVRRSGSSIEVGIALAARGSLRRAVLEWLRQEARRTFLGRIAEWAPRLAVRPPELRLSNARTQWGSCSARGRVHLNWRLVHMPLRLVDYVVAHELAHLREMNHSARFWELVGSVYPDYATARRELERLGRQLPEL